MAKKKVENLLFSLTQKIIERDKKTIDAKRCEKTRWDENLVTVIRRYRPYDPKLLRKVLIIRELFSGISLLLNKFPIAKITAYRRIK